MRVVGSNGVVELNATPGLPLAVASPSLRMEWVYGTAGMRARRSDQSKNCSVRASNDAGDGKERIGSCAGIGVVPVKEDREEGQAKGRQHAKQMVVEQLTVLEPQQ